MPPPLTAEPKRPAVRLTKVTKTFGQHTAVNQLSLEVPRGCTYGFIGPNGSGKTTTIRTILHIFHPDSGEVEVLGEHSTRAANDRIGYLPEERGLYKKMTVRRVLAYYAALKGMKRSDAAGEIQRWLTKMGLTEWADKKVEALSKGMAQKIQFIAAVVARPELLILDEPFSGLDPVNLEVIRSAILELRAAGTTIIFSTHDMAMAETMCDFIFMIYRGNKVLDGTLADIQRSYGEDTIRVSCAGGAELLRSLPGVELVRDLGQSQELRHADAQALLRDLATRTTVRHFEVCKPSLHDIFIRIAKPDLQEMQVPKTTGGGS